MYREAEARMAQRRKKRATLAGMLIAIGIVYGDIGTSPMYVMKAILEGNGGLQYVDRDFIIGAFSLVIWTITLLTTIQFVMIAMQADNDGEGGIFALYSLIRKYGGKLLVLAAMVGGATMLADGILTPAVTVTNAIDGLKSIDYFNAFLGTNQWYVVGIVLVILTALFLIQQEGTSKIGSIFGPAMLIWFGFLGITGIYNMFGDLSVWQALNPLHAVEVLRSPNNKVGFMILGSVFLATTGAEALYADMGHIGRENIYASWPFVKLCLLLNYAGQCAWILEHRADGALYGMEINPFFQMLPQDLRPVAVVLSAVAAIIASQALITGSFTLVSEAINLDLLPHMQIRYPSDSKGQLYIPLVNALLWVGCVFIVVHFQYSSRMENAYGLAITLSMLATTLLLVVYLQKLKKQWLLGALVGVVFGALEFVFFLSSCGKFMLGGYIAVLISLAIFGLMLVWYRGSILEHTHSVMMRTSGFVDNFRDLRADAEVPKTTDNLVFFTTSADPDAMERDILYSALDKEPKRALAYWFIHVNVTNQPFDRSYSVETFGTDFMFYVKLNLGFKVDQKVNVYMYQVVQDLMASGELPKQERKYSIYGPAPVGTFKFCFIRRTLPESTDFSRIDDYIIWLKYAVRRAIGDRVKWFGLENSNLIIEHVPLAIFRRKPVVLYRD